jgi:hypothetical protein
MKSSLACAKTNQSSYTLKALLFILYIVPILIGTNKRYSNVVGIVVTIIIICLFFTDKFYLTLPIFIIFPDQLLILGSKRLSNILMLLILVYIIVRKRRIKISVNQIIILVIITIYSFTYLAFEDVRFAISLWIPMIACILYVGGFLKQEDKLNEFLKYYVYAVLSGTVYGFLFMSQRQGAMLVNSQWVFYNRFLGTCTDPNYWGFYVNIAIGIVLMSKLLRGKLKIGVLIILYAGLLASTSMTGYICNVIIIFIYLLANKVKLKYIFVISIFVGSVIICLYYATIYKIPILTDAVTRIMIKFSTSEDMSSFTTGRSDLWISHLKYYYNLNIFHILFGGIVEISQYSNKQFSLVVHQEYIELLLNTGLIGCLSVIMVFIRGLVIKKSNIKQISHDIWLSNQWKIYFTIKCIWLFYSLGLSMFMDWKFYLFLLI